MSGTREKTASENGRRAGPAGKTVGGDRAARRSRTAGADLLEQIAACGSLSEAARRLRFSYRRAWLLIDAMNRHWPRPLVKTAIGGKRGGGTRLTELGRAVLSGYRDLQVQLEHLLDQASPAFLAILASEGH